MNRNYRINTGARALARLNMHCGWTQEISSPLPIRELKRRERRVP
jgi:hypothetical protein